MLIKFFVQCYLNLTVTIEGLVRNVDPPFEPLVWTPLGP